ncbi:MAG: phosphoribosyltransferase [Deltaproteobacteria bacterium]|nr:phosphoribosyltransferase [Deltaproteobacteria bacterium]
MTDIAIELLERIRTEGRIDGDVVKVDHFLNHMVDPCLVQRMAAHFAEGFRDCLIDKVLTAETSGIPLAQAVALELQVPYVYAKKKKPVTMVGFYAAASFSFTKQETTTLYVSSEVLAAGERLLFVDDFLAKGSTLKAIEDIVAQAGAVLAGRAFIINKSARTDVDAILSRDHLVNF